MPLKTTNFAYICKQNVKERNKQKNTKTKWLRFFRIVGLLIANNSFTTTGIIVLTKRHNGKLNKESHNFAISTLQILKKELYLPPETPKRTRWKHSTEHMPTLWNTRTLRSAAT